MKSFLTFLRESKRLTLVDVITTTEFKTIKSAKDFPGVSLVIIGVTDTKPLKASSPVFPTEHFEDITDDGEFTRKVIPGPAKKSFLSDVRHWADYSMSTLIVSDTIEKGNAIAEFLIKMNLMDGNIKGNVNKTTLDGLMTN
jgi:hypothetical protein